METPTRPSWLLVSSSSPSIRSRRVSRRRGSGRRASWPRTGVSEPSRGLSGRPAIRVESWWSVLSLCVIGPGRLNIRISWRRRREAWGADQAQVGPLLGVVTVGLVGGLVVVDLEEAWAD